MTEHSAAGSSGEFKGPLAGLVVVDLSRALAGPHAGMMLGDLGARVIKVESPEGDDSRGWGPPFLHGSNLCAGGSRLRADQVILPRR